VEDSSSTLAVVAKGGECRVQGVGTETTVVANSNFWQLNFGVKIEISGK
jgi:hypothetical protein